MFGPDTTPEDDERALKGVNSKKRTTLDITLMVVLLSVIAAGLVSVFIGVASLAIWVF